MSILTHSPAIVRDGLVLCLDAGAVRSYPGTGPELVSNGNFESSFTNYWTIRAGQTEGNQVLTQDSSIVKSGTYSAKIVVGGSSPNYDGMKSDSSGNFTLTNGKRYLLSFDVYPVNDTGIDAYIVAGSTYCGTNVTGLTQGAWNNVELFIDVTATSSSSFVEFQTGSAWGAGTWHFDNVSVREVLWNDLSGNFNNGTLVNAPAFSAESGAGGTKSFDFDGTNDYISIGNDSSLNFGSAGNFTLEAVVKLGTADDNLMIAGKQNGHFGQGYAIRIEESGSSNDWGVQLHAEQSDGTMYRYISTQNIKQDFTHIIAVFDRSSAAATLYLNGANGITGTTISANLSALGDLDVSQDFTIGGDSDGNYNIDGKIVIVRVYNRALTSTEAKQNFRATKGRFGK